MSSVSATILRLDYGHNAVHDRTYERYGASGAAGDAFEYDKLRRLTVAWMGSSNPASPSGNSYVKKIQYNYDDDGNRTSVVTTPYGQSAQTTTYSTNNLNEYTSVGGTTQVSDANGNLTDDGTYLFLYDYKNHIVQVKLKSTSAVIASYRYDALGRRVEKNVGGTVERHVLSIWNDPGVVEDLSHVVSVYDGSNNWKQDFVWSDQVDGIQMLEQKDILDYDSDGNTSELTRSFYHRNVLGAIMEITDLNQVVVVSYRYDPYGNVTITRGGSSHTTDPLGQHWTFTGRFLDDESGLLYYRARFYDPRLGRFIHRDPLGYLSGPSLYQYALNTPTNYIDPAGTTSVSVGGVGEFAAAIAHVTEIVANLMKLVKLVTLEKICDCGTTTVTLTMTVHVEAGAGGLMFPLIELGEIGDDAASDLAAIAATLALSEPLPALFFAITDWEYSVSQPFYGLFGGGNTVITFEDRCVPPVASCKAGWINLWKGDVTVAIEGEVDMKITIHWEITLEFDLDLEVYLGPPIRRRDD